MMIILSEVEYSDEEIASLEEQFNGRYHYISSSLPLPKLEVEEDGILVIGSTYFVCDMYDLFQGKVDIYRMIWSYEDHDLKKEIFTY